MLVTIACEYQNQTDNEDDCEAGQYGFCCVAHASSKYDVTKLHNVAHYVKYVFHSRISLTAGAQAITFGLL